MAYIPWTRINGKRVNIQTNTKQTNAQPNETTTEIVTLNYRS